MKPRNKLIGIILGKRLGYVTQVIFVSSIAELINLRTAMLVEKSLKHSGKIIQVITKHYAREDFRSETIFSDAIDASFFAD